MVRSLLLSMPDIYQPWPELHINGNLLGGMSISGNCLEHEVFIADLVLKRKDVRGGIKEAVELAKPEIIGLSAMTFQYPTAVRVAKHIRREYPRIPIILGGYHATSARREISQSPEGQVFDYLFAGESEETFNQLLNEEPLENIPRISFRKNGTWAHNPRSRERKELSNLKLPKRDSRIWLGYYFHSRKFDTAEFSRGCGNNCRFCSVKLMYPGMEHRTFPPERVIEDLRTIRKRGIQSIYLADDNPAMHPGKFKEFLYKLKKELDDLYLFGSVSTGSMQDPELTDLMREVGWDSVFLGVDNVSTLNLRAMNKPSNARIARRAIMNLYNSGITILAGMIVGNPDDTVESIRENLQWFQGMPVDTVIPQYLTPYPGTPMRKELLEEGLIVNKGGVEDNSYGGWSTYNGEFAQCRTRSGLMPEDIETIVYEEKGKLVKEKMLNVLRGKSNFPKNNPKHLARIVMHESLPLLTRTFRERRLNSSEKTRLDRKRKIAMNQFNI